MTVYFVFRDNRESGRSLNQQVLQHLETLHGQQLQLQVEIHPLSYVFHVGLSPQSSANCFFRIILI